MPEKLRIEYENKINILTLIFVLNYQSSIFLKIIIITKYAFILDFYFNFKFSIAC